MRARAFATAPTEKIAQDSQVASNTGLARRLAFCETSAAAKNCSPRRRYLLVKLPPPLCNDQAIFKADATQQTRPISKSGRVAIHLLFECWQEFFSTLAIAQAPNVIPSQPVQVNVSAMRLPSRSRSSCLLSRLGKYLLPNPSTISSI